ncbi:MAG: phosphoribosylformylglycinamidine synthase, partial [Clostridia bacterium]|nr:phosphoribosylformylglycinamidine synthase [Clostridia bacterium]
MVYRIFVEKKEGLAYESYSLKRDVNRLLGIKGVTDVRILNRYDAENLPKETFDFACNTIFSEPQIDTLYTEVPEGADRVFAVEYLPGQFDQRANSAEECIQLAFKGDRPSIRSAKVY